MHGVPEPVATTADIGLFIFLGLCALLVGGYLITGFCLLFFRKTRWLGASLLALPLILAVVAVPVIVLITMSYDGDAQSYDTPRARVQDYPSEGDRPPTDGVGDDAGHAREIDDAGSFVEESVEHLGEIDHAAGHHHGESLQPTAASHFRSWAYSRLLVIGVVVLIVGMVALLLPNMTDNFHAKRVGKAVLLGVSVVVCLCLIWLGLGKSSPQRTPLEGGVAENAPNRDEVSSVVADSSASSESENLETSSTERPEWVDRKPYTADSVLYVPVTPGPFENREACEEAMKLMIDEVVEQRVVKLVGPMSDTQMHKIIASLPQSELVADRYVETSKLSIGPLDDVEMKQHYALLQFDPSFTNHVNQQWEEIVVEARLAQTALFSGGFIALLATCFAFLRFDTASQGIYTRRLQIASVAVILIVLVTGMILSRTILWV